MSGRWDQEVVHGTLESGEDVSFKETLDHSEILVARGHVEDIQPDIDHVHAWDQGGENPGHHDMDWTEPLFDGPDSTEPEHGGA